MGIALLAGGAPWVWLHVWWEKILVGVPVDAVVLLLLVAAWQAITESHPPAANPRTLSGVAYEAHCSSVLRQAGWSTSLTPATGDMGVDIIATRNGLKLVVQCKQHKAAVGVAAVQQVVAGMAYYRAGASIVVAENGFTASAKEMARKTGTTLCNSSQLAKVWQAT